MTVAALFVALWAAPVFAQDLGVARERSRACQKLLDADKPCEAVKACNEGLAAAPDNPALLEQLAEAQRRCAAAKPHSGSTASACPYGMTVGRDTLGHCCWPGQAWNARCVGPPTSCPDGFVLSADTETCEPGACDAFGRVWVVAATERHCCWPGQAWRTTEQRCIGRPSCPTGMRSDTTGDGCEEIPLDTDGDGVVDAADQCPERPEDADGHQDDDGCPDDDHDGDGVCDSGGEAGAASSCVGVDRCPGEPEDPDGFEDDDGCPDPDNDGDGVVDVQDGCPGEAEDVDGVEDTDGCPEETTAERAAQQAKLDYDANTDALRITGWVAVGVGVASLGTGVGLWLDAERRRDLVRQPEKADGPIILSVKQSEVPGIIDTADAMSTAGVVAMSVGPALAATGVVLLLVDRDRTLDTFFTANITATGFGISARVAF